MKPELVRYRLERAEEALNDAHLLLSEKRLAGAVNRLYYSMFYAVVALLESKDFSSSKHTGVRALFNQHFVKTGVVSKDAGRLFNDLFLDRHKGDYADFVEFTIEQVADYHESCRKSINEIRIKAFENVDNVTA